MKLKSNSLVLCTLAAITLLALFLSCGNDDDVTRSTDFVVLFPDANLEAVIRKAVGIDTGDIYFSDLQVIENFHADAHGIKNISGIGNCEELRTLSLNDNLFANTGPLRGLSHLKDLSCSHNYISDINALASLLSLEKVNLDANRITDIGDLPNISKLKSIYLSNNQISDINILARANKLETLYLDHNRIIKINALTGPSNLRLIDLRYNQISDISPLVNNNDLGYGVEIRLTGNPLSTESLENYIPELRARRVNVVY